MILMNKNTLAYFLKLRGPLCGQVVSMLAFFSDVPSLNPAEADSFLKRTKINSKRARGCTTF